MKYQIKVGVSADIYWWNIRWKYFYDFTGSIKFKIQKYSSWPINIWSNKKLGSTRNCRLVGFEYPKEMPEKTWSDINSIRDGIQTLIPHELKLRMIDGEVCQVVTGTESSSSCTICVYKLSEMNNLEY